MKPKILFLYPNAVMQNPPPMALAIFAALLRDTAELRLFDTTFYDMEEKTSDQAKENNLQVRPFDFAARGIALKTTDPYADLRALAVEFKPDLVALSATEVTFELGQRLLRSISDLHLPALVGGVFATFAPDYVIGLPEVTMVCVGEGEGVLQDIVRQLAVGGELAAVPNLWYKRADGSIVRNPVRKAASLDALPVPDYSLFDEARLYRPMAGRVWRLLPIETNRGCPYSCTFCNSPYMTQLYRDQGAGTFFRKKSVARIAAELENAVTRWGAEYIYFLSDTLLTMTDAEFDEFCHVYGKYKLPFWCQNRPEAITDARTARLKAIGCQRMSIGLEHGNEQFRHEVLHKKTTNDSIRRAFAILAKHGIPVTVNNIIGFPGETRDLIFDTIRLNRELTFDTSNAYAFTPFHGTDLYRLSVARGYLDPQAHLQCMTKGTVLDMPQLSRAEINGLVKTFALYARLPEDHWPRIRAAEADTEEGNRVFAELRRIYIERYFS